MNEVASIIVLDTKTSIIDETSTEATSIATHKLGIAEEPLNTDIDLNRNEIIIEVDIEMSKTRTVLDDIHKELDIDSDGTKDTDKKKDYIIDGTEETIDISEAELQNFAADLDVVFVNGKKKDSDVIIIDEKIIDTDVILVGENIADSDIIVLDGNKTDSESTIILDEDEINKLSTERLPRPYVPVIDVERDTDCSIVGTSSIRNKLRNEYNELFKANSLLSELIEKCLDMEHSEGMSRVINRTLLVIYKDVDENYKKSDALTKVINKAIMQLDIEPERKFLHLKNLCSELKKYRVKKKVPFFTLEEGKEERSTSFIPRKRSRVDAIIDLDEDTRNDLIQLNPTQRVKRKKDYPIGKVYPSIEINDDESSSDIAINDDENSSDIAINDDAYNVTLADKNCKSIKENSKKSKKITRNNNNGPKRKQGSLGTDINHYTSNANLDKSLLDPRDLLEPRLSVEVFTESKQDRINIIESHIANMKRQLDVLEEEEVNSDNDQSPYLKCELIKTNILNLYKELCELTGTEVTKRHEVRLHVIPGHPEGPVRCLEEFLNANIDEDGNPPFPDMHDVLRCVCEANDRYGMNWKRAQMLTEAQAIFTQFGRSMQKRRQKREWKDLMSLVKQELPDPADEDSALQARLMENARIARQNEQVLLERFATMKHKPMSHRVPELGLSVHQSEESDEDDEGSSYPGEIIVTSKVPADHETVTKVGHNAASEITVRADLGPQKAAGGITVRTDLCPQIAAGGITVRTDLCPQIAAGGITVRTDLGPQIAAGGITVRTDLGPQIAAGGITVRTDLCPQIAAGGITVRTDLCPQIAAGGITVRTDLGPQKVASEIADNTAAVGLQKAASESTLKPLRLDDHSNRYGSKVTVCGGKIVIQPTVNYDVASNEYLSNTTKPKHKDEITPYSSEFQAFINNSNVKPTSCNLNALFRAIKNLSETTNISNDTSVQKTLCNNEHDLANSASLEGVGNCARDILSVQSDSTEGYVKETLNVQPQTIHNTSAENDHCFVKTVTNSALKADDSYTKHGKPDEFHIPNTTKIQDNLNTIIETNKTAGKELNTCEDVKENECNISEVHKEISDDTNAIDNLEGRVKPEPLDIPSMLEKLGDNFTATIFDIEDPFLVIEISDSSESEDE